ncbi:DUF4355 domain-containing protein [Exiguobacterium sp. AB2]|uniref:capsid assembly scaffolding protein Gp46 family protein n=1 Tax=Exiguobacterium sp. AB2 TaxID=1484479 RepID=UPI0004A907B9|nr:DUF4355 domain-containing protein [Exiguobacterium sp. AB2]KDN58455.1 hypothetical protein DI14_04780 [Exiguobacterium sp. AB2]
MENNTNETVGTVETNTETPNALTQEAVQEMIAAALAEKDKELDRVRNEYGKKLKTKEQELQTIKTSNMTEAEKQAQALEDARNEITQKERDLLERENKLFAVDALNKAEMPLTFLEFVTSDSEEVTTSKIETLKTTFDSEVQKAVDAAFKNKGRTVAKGTGGAVTAQDFEKMTYQQRVELYKNDPALYNTLSAGN